MSNGTPGTMNPGVWDLIGLHNIYTTHIFTGNFSGIFIYHGALGHAVFAAFESFFWNYHADDSIDSWNAHTHTHTHKYLQPIWRFISLKQMVLTITLETFKSQKCQRGSCIIPKMFEYI